MKDSAIILKSFSTNNNKFITTPFVEEFENHEVTQTKLVINFKTDVTIFNGDYYAFLCLIVFWVAVTQNFIEKFVKNKVLYII